MFPTSSMKWKNSLTWNGGVDGAGLTEAPEEGVSNESNQHLGEGVGRVGTRAKSVCVSVELIVLDFSPLSEFAKESTRAHNAENTKVATTAATTTAEERERHERASECVRAAEARGDSLDGKAATTP